jgi:hypothetical protein
MFHAKKSSLSLLFVVSIGWQGFSASALQQQQPNHHPHQHRGQQPKISSPNFVSFSSRRETLGWFLSVGGGAILASAAGLSSPPAAWAASAVQDSMNVDSFLRTGVDGGGNMGVSSQAGKSKPQTGVFLR